MAAQSVEALTVDLAITLKDAAERVDSAAPEPAVARAAGTRAAQSTAGVCTEMTDSRLDVAVAVVASDCGRCVDASRGTISTGGSSPGGQRTGHRNSRRRRPARPGSRVPRTRRRTSHARKAELRRVPRQGNRAAGTRHRVLARGTRAAR